MESVSLSGRVVQFLHSARSATPHDGNHWFFPTPWPCPNDGRTPIEIRYKDLQGI